MKHINHLSRLILALFLIALANPASAQKLIVGYDNDNSNVTDGDNQVIRASWGNQITKGANTINSGSTFNSGALKNNGSAKASDSDNFVFYNNAKYQTYDFTNTSSDYISFHVVAGTGTIQVDYLAEKQTLNLSDAEIKGWEGGVSVKGNAISFNSEDFIGWNFNSSPINGSEYSKVCIEIENPSSNVYLKAVYPENVEEQCAASSADFIELNLKDKNLNFLFIYGEVGKTVNVKSIYLVKKIDNSANKLVVKRHASTDSYSDASVVNAGSRTVAKGATVTYTFNFNNLEETYYYLTGAKIGHVTVSGVRMNNNAYDLSPVTTDFFMYYNGGNGIYTVNTYTNSNHIYRFTADDSPIGASNGYPSDVTALPQMQINGEVYGGSADYCSYDLTPTDSKKAIGFKLDPTKKYRVKIYGRKVIKTSDTEVDLNNFDFLYVGNALSSATNVGTTQRSWVGGDTRLATYDIATPSSEIYWITGLYLAGFEILPYGEGNTAGSALEAPSTWYFDSYQSEEKNKLSANEATRAADVVRSGAHDNVAINGPSLVFQNGGIDGHQVVQFRNGTEIQVKLPAKSRIKIKYNVWNENMGITINSTPYPRGEGNSNDVTLYYPASGYTTAEQTITIGGIAGQDYLSIAGFEIEKQPEPRIEFDTNVPGIFTGKHRNKLLIYCTDNGTQENFVLPRALFVDPDPDAPREINITTTATKEPFPNRGEYNAGGSSNDGCKIKVKNVNNKEIPYLGSSDPNHIYAFEDTDNDKLYEITYSYYDATKNVTVENSYYLWFANFLKVGWWVNRDAKLIVGSNDSSKDPDNIIVSDFYISSASTGHLYYEMFELPEYTTEHPFDANDPDIKCSWKITKDNNTMSGWTDIVYDPTELDEGATTTWTYTNDDKGHGGDNQTINVRYPANTSAWGDGEVVKEVYFKAERKGWPTWTAHIRFHFVKAPTVNCSVSENVGTTTMTKAPNCNADIYYTTDGTAPVVSVDDSGNCTPQYATYKYESPITSNYSTYFYATQMVKVDHKFYIHNPYTTNVFGKKFADLVDEGRDNVSEYFPAMSRPQETFTSNSTTTTYSNGVLVLNDPLVEYFDSNFKLMRTNAAGTSTTSSLKVNDDGGFVYSYPFGSSATYTDGRLMNVLFGEKDTKVYRSNVFTEVGMKWSTDGTFDEHLDAHQYRFKTQGANYNKDQNGNPHTECNAGIGGEKTEDGGMFLQPVAGDFMRFEPEYDGVITVWIRQNGAGQSDEVQGNITRRPVYFMDENGKVMKRSTVKPSSEHFFCINGTYGEINANNATMRQDCRIDWLNGLKHWRRNYDNDPDQTLDKRFKATFGLFNYWYGFPMYQNKNTDGHVKSNTESDYFKYTMDVADSWISRTAAVQSVICPWNSLLYRSENLAGLEASSIKYTNEDGDQKSVADGEGLSKYGYEMPSYSVVRYRFPVKAGKSYYMGGRGTKNGFVAYKFDKLQANYAPAYYNWDDNRRISEADYTCQTMIEGTYPKNSVPSDADINTTYRTWNETDGGSATHIHVFSRAGQENSDDLYPNGTEDRTKTGWKAFTDDELFIDSNSAADRGAQQGLTVNASLWRGFEAGKWYSIVLPFSISESRMKELFGPKVQVLYLDPYNNTIAGGAGGDYRSAGRPAIEGSKLSFTYHKYQMLYANTPAFVCPSKNCGQGYETSSRCMEIERVTLDKTNLTDGSYDNIGYKIGETTYNGTEYEYWITGTYDYKEAGSGEMYFISNESRNGVNQVSMYRSAEGVEVQPTRCWIEVRKKSDGTRVKTGAPRLTEIGFGGFDPDEDFDDPSGIDDVIMDDYTVDRYNDGGVYDMLGRRIGEGSLDGLPKGVYIFNGQKVYVR